MSIGIIGAKGNMGRRYGAICSYLSVPWLGFDVDDLNTVWDYKDSLKSLLIATPTNTHLDLIHHLSRMGKPMLVEKPIVTSEDDLGHLLSGGYPIKMVNQYQYLYDSSSDGESYYDYWNSGKDGVWDFINIVGLAQKPPILRNISPLWKCQINGKTLSIKDMDHAYCDMIWNWHKNPKPDLDYIERAHRKVLEGFYVL
jgi:hypothetical protein